MQEKIFATTKAPKVCRCLDIDDKTFILKIIDDKIDRENAELRKIISKKDRTILEPSFAKPFIGIRLSLIKSHEDFKKKVESLKNIITAYPECEKGIKHSISGEGPSVPYPGYYEMRKRMGPF